MPLGIIGAVVGVGSLIEGAFGQHKANQVANAQLGIQQQYANEDSIRFGEQQGFEKQLADLLMNPSSVSKLPGYGFFKDQGEQSLARQMGSGGYLGSGNMGASLVQYGQDYASKSFMDYVGILSQLSGVNQQMGTPGVNPVGGQTAANANLSNLTGQMGVLAGLFGGAGMAGGSAGSGGGISSIWDSGGGAGGSSPWYMNPWYSGGMTYGGGGGTGVIANTGTGAWGG